LNDVEETSYGEIEISQMAPYVKLESIQYVIVGNYNNIADIFYQKTNISGW
jgi:hypothetical protein